MLDVAAPEAQVLVVPGEGAGDDRLLAQFSIEALDILQCHMQLRRGGCILSCSHYACYLEYRFFRETRRICGQMYLS